MNANAIYSKSGKGVQEAAGKTSLLSRPDRAVLSAIDGRATLQDVAAKVGKPYDQGFEQLITKLDKDGFIREVSAGTVGAAAPAAKPMARAPAKPAPKAAEPSDPASDLDFSSLGGPSKPSSSQPPAAKAPPPRPAAPPPRPAAPPSAPPPPPKDQESALFKARQEAEAKAQAEKDRQRKEAEDKVRAETEGRLRAEAEAKARAEAEAKVAAENEAKLKAAREAAIKAAAEAKAKADAEAKRAREEAERAKREAEERERKAREEAERAKREAEERERKAREEAERLRKEAEERERKAREEAERIRREAEEKARREQEELRRRLEEERRAREEAERKAREDAERLRREAEAEAERVRRQAEEEAERTRRELEEERRALEDERRRAREEEARAEEARAAKAAAREPEPPREAPPARKEPAPAQAPAGGGFADSLMADLDSFKTEEEAHDKAKEEAELKAREEAARRAREAEERRAREEAERAEREARQRDKEEKARKKREEEERLRREEEEAKARIRAEEERREREAEERKRKAKEEEALARQATSTTVGYVSEDARRKRQLEVGRRDPSLARRKERSWGKTAALTLFFALLAALGAAHVMPISTLEYERAASEALGRPVRLGDARLWLFTGLELRIDGASAGDVKVGRVVARPSIFSLTDQKKTFSSIELHGVSVPQQELGAVLFARLKGDLFEVKQLMARQLELPGPLPLPKGLDADLIFRADGTVLSGVLRGPEGFVARLEPKDGEVGFQVDAASFSVPFAPGITLSTFGMKGVASAQGAQIKEWGGALLGGNISGTARVRWGGTWVVEGVMTARGINAAVFAPALLSEGTAEGTGKFSLVGPEPAKLGANGRMEGNFSVGKGVLGSFDLSRAIQTSGKQAQGRTQFAEMNGQAIYDRGEVELRNVTIGAGALNAGATAAIDEKGALSGRIVADVRTASQTLRATLLLGGTVKEPQVRN